MKARKRRIILEAWSLAKPYWTSEEKWSAWGLLLAIVVLNLGNVYVGIRINQWNRSFYNALQMFDSVELFSTARRFLHCRRFCDFNVRLWTLPQPDAPDPLAAVANA
jgi:ABC-type uncharacterized transport system fused permease/ATPase subunit